MSKSLFIKHAKSLGMKVTEDQHAFVLAFVMKNATEFQLMFQVHEHQPEVVLVEWHVGDKQYHMNMSLDTFLEVKPGDLYILLDANDAANAEVKSLQERLKKIPLEQKAFFKMWLG